MTLVDELKQLIISSLNLEDVTPDEIENEAPLFNDGLGLDSIDALELGMALKQHYGVELKGENSAKHFASVNSLAEFISQNAPQSKA